jgi:hypothetical protein
MPRGEQVCIPRSTIRRTGAIQCTTTPFAIQLKAGSLAIPLRIGPHHIRSARDPSRRW